MGKVWRSILKSGDYARVVTSVHDDRMPADGRRDCLVLEMVGQKRDQAQVLFHNGNILKFHISQLEKLGL